TRDASSEAGVKLENRGTFGMAGRLGYSSQSRTKMVRPADHILPYSVYGVSRRHREPLLQFLHDALAVSGCRVACLHARLEHWQYSLALRRDLDPLRKCPGKLSSNVVVDTRWQGDIR